MPRQMFLLFPVALALLITLGCRSSAKSAQSSAAASASSSRAQEPASVPPKVAPSSNAVAKMPIPTHEPPPPPMDTMVPVKTFEIQLPVAFTADQLPPDEAVEFHFTGKAGQMLRVRVGSYRVRIQAPGGATLGNGWDETGNWLYGLPETGAYRVLYAPWKTTPGIQFDFLPDDDPKVDPGVKPEQVSVDFGALAQGRALTIVPFAIDEEGELFWESWPTHLAVVQRGFEFRIMTVAGNKEVFKKNERMTALEAALRAQGKGVDVGKLPYPVLGDGGLNLWTKPKFFEGDGWRGLRWIGAFSDDFSCNPNGYIFEGISNDGLFFIMMRAQVSNLKVGHRLDQGCVDKIRERGSIDLLEKEMPALFDRDLSAADPASFQPNLDQLDAVIRSLKLKP